MNEYIRSDAVLLTKKLVQIPSTNPGTYEKNMLLFLKDYFSGFSPIVTEECETTLGRRNLMASYLPDKAFSEPAFVFLCHMDTVPVNEGWTHPPFDGIIEDGMLYGRGSCDMKSGFACALSAFSSLAQKYEKGILPVRPVKFIATTDEEVDMTGIEAAIKAGWIGKNDYIMDTEPTGLTLQMAHKGRAWFLLKVKGITAHASMPEEGIDAIAVMAKLITLIRTQIHHLPAHPILGTTTCVFGTISGGTQPYVVPDACEVTIDCRFVPPTSFLNLTDLLDFCILQVKNEFPGILIEYDITGNRPAIDEHPDSLLYKALQKTYEHIFHAPIEIKPFPGYTDTAVAAGMLGNHNCLSFGPGDLKYAHKPDERVSISDIEKAKEVLTSLAAYFYETGIL